MSSCFCGSRSWDLAALPGFLVGERAVPHACTTYLIVTNHIPAEKHRVKLLSFDQIRKMPGAKCVISANLFQRVIRDSENWMPIRPPLSFLNAWRRCPDSVFYAMVLGSIIHVAYISSGAIIESTALNRSRPCKRNRRRIGRSAQPQPSDATALSLL